MTVSELKADLCLPERWSLSSLLWESPELSEGFILVSKGRSGPNPNEYTLGFNVLPVGETIEEGDEDDLELCLRNVKFDMFPPGLENGCVQLGIQSLRSSFLLGTGLKLNESFFAASVKEHDGKRRASLAGLLHETQKKLIGLLSI